MAFGRTSGSHPPDEHTCGVQRSQAPLITPAVAVDLYDAMLQGMAQEASRADFAIVGPVNGDALTPPAQISARSRGPVVA
jgi:hypothetical protein